MEEVTGSSPVSSTIFFIHKSIDKDPFYPLLS